MSTINTTLHRFNFDTRNPAEKAAWEALRSSLKDGPRKMESHGGGSHYPTFKGEYRDAQSVAVTLETGHLFDNQWNTGADCEALPNCRVFDFAFDYNPSGNPYLKRGHWIEQTDAMRELRRDTMSCGYCGKQEHAQKNHVFCPHCLGSEYLTEKELGLLRMLPVSESFDKRSSELSEAELAHLVPLWRDAQINGNTERDKSRIAKARADVAKEYERVVRKATIERDGKTWLMDRGINTANIIFYNHSGRWSWGWRTKVNTALLPDVSAKLAGFPFHIDIECADGTRVSLGARHGV